MSIYDGYPGIKEDQYGIRASVTVGSGPGKQQKVKRFQRGTPLKTITDWQDRTRVALRDGPRIAAEGPARRRCRALPHASEGAARGIVLCEPGVRAERLARAVRPPARATPSRASMVLEQRRRWLTEPRGGPTARKGTRDAQPHAPKTCNHRLRALRRPLPLPRRQQGADAVRRHPEAARAGGRSEVRQRRYDQDRLRQPHRSEDARAVHGPRRRPASGRRN